MTPSEVKKLKLGLYCLYWKAERGGGFSLAAVGMTHTQHWYAPTNWTTEKENGDGIACTDWGKVDAAELLVSGNATQGRFKIETLEDSDRREQCGSYERVKRF